MVDVLARLRPSDLDRRVELLGFRADDAADLLAVVRRVADDQAALDGIDALVTRLLGGIGDFCADGTENPWDHPAARFAQYGPGVLPLLTLLATVDDVRAFHASRGVPDAVSWRSLSDLGQQVWVHRLTYGCFGLETFGWLCVAWSGALYWLGRLQFNLQLEDDEWVLSTHIPRSGPLDPAAVDEAFAAAAAFFGRHFPDHATKSFFCDSWLLDPALAAGLPPASNIAQFQRRWGLYGSPRPGDDDAVYFTFARRGPVALDELPQRSSLERLIVGRLRVGEHWQVWKGRTALPDLDARHGSGARLARPDQPVAATSRGVPMTDLTLVRHGATEWSANGRHTSVTDLDLTKDGVRQAEALRGRLHPDRYGLVLSSPRRRALRTAELAGFTGAHEPEVTDDVVEWFYGDYEGLTSVQIQEQVPDWTIWTHAVPNGETAEEVTARLDRLIARVRASGVDQAIVFAHGHSLRALACRWLGLEVGMGAHFPLDTGTLSVLGDLKGFSTIDSWNASLG